MISNHFLNYLLEFNVKTTIGNFIKIKYEIFIKMFYSSKTFIYKNYHIPSYKFFKINSKTEFKIWIHKIKKNIFMQDIFIHKFMFDKKNCIRRA